MKNISLLCLLQYVYFYIMECNKRGKCVSEICIGKMYRLLWLASIYLVREFEPLISQRSPIRPSRWFHFVLKLNGIFAFFYLYRKYRLCPIVKDLQPSLPPPSKRADGNIFLAYVSDDFTGCLVDLDKTWK